MELGPSLGEKKLTIGDLQVKKHFQLSGPTTEIVIFQDHHLLDYMLPNLI